MAALEASLPTLLAKLNTSLASTSQALPTADLIAPPTDGISLFDVKTELFLSYLQNLALLLLVKLRHRHDPSSTPSAHALQDEITTQLVTLRVHLDKGVRPLEHKLKFQLDKVVSAAEDALRAHPAPSTDAPASDDDTAYRPNAAAFLKPAPPTTTPRPDPKALYRPPRITPTALPAPRLTPRKPQRSAVLESYIASELSGAPAAEANVGADIGGGGRFTKSARERAQEAARRDYEETNFVRLPGMGRKERGKVARGREGEWAGESLRGLGRGLERIERLTGKRGAVGQGGGGGKRRK